MINGSGRQVEDKPLISIVMATLNAAHVLTGAIDSIIQHSPANTELIVVDGGSHDGTLNILNTYEHCIIQWISEPDGGIYDAMNKGVKLASGRWIYFMGADDRLLAGFKAMTTHLTQANTLYYGNAEADGPIFSGKFSKYRLAKYCINHQSIFYPKQIFERLSFNTGYTVHADYALNMACWANNFIRKKYLPISVAFYNTNGYSSKAKDPAFINDKPILIRKHLGLIVFIRYVFKRFRERNRTSGLFKSVNH